MGVSLNDENSCRGILCILIKLCPSINITNKDRTTKGADHLAFAEISILHKSTKHCHSIIDFAFYKTDVLLGNISWTPRNCLLCLYSKSSNSIRCVIKLVELLCIYACVIVNQILTNWWNRLRCCQSIFVFKVEISSEWTSFNLF